MDSSAYTASDNVPAEVDGATRPADKTVGATCLDAPADNDSVPAGTESEVAADRDDLEVICGFPVHPLASKFPLIVGEEFDELVDSIRRAGTVTAVELHDGVLIDGRNRGRAIEELRRQGVEIELPTVEWQPTGDETLEEHIYSVNVYRRHLTPDQRAVLALEFLPQIRAARQARQEASRFGKNRADAAAVISPPPEVSAASGVRTSAEKDAASSVGHLAAMSDISRYKAGQAVALFRAVERGDVSESEIDAVAAGDKRLRDVVPYRKSGGKKKARADAWNEQEDELIFDAAPIPSEDEARRLWEEQKTLFAIADHRDWRRHFLKVIGDEQRALDR